MYTQNMLTRQRTLPSLLDAAGQPDWLLCRAVTQLPTLDESPLTHRSLISRCLPHLAISPPLSPGYSFPTNRSSSVGTRCCPIAVLCGVGNAMHVRYVSHADVCCAHVLSLLAVQATAIAVVGMGRNQRGSGSAYLYSSHGGFV